MPSVKARKCPRASTREGEEAQGLRGGHEKSKRILLQERGTGSTRERVVVVRTGSRFAEREGVESECGVSTLQVSGISGQVFRE